MLVHAVEHVVAASVLNAVPVPDVVFPPGHAIHVAEDAELYEPIAHVPHEFAAIPVVFG